MMDVSVVRCNLEHPTSAKTLKIPLKSAMFFKFQLSYKGRGINLNIKESIMRVDGCK